MRTIRQEWNDFAAIVFASVKDVSDVQRKEMKRAFHAGANVMLTLTCEASEHQEDEACRLMDQLDEELDAFFKAVAEGRA